MDVLRLNGLDSLIRLLETVERDRPGLILVGSATSPLSLELREDFHRLAGTLPQFVFYEFDTDACRTPGKDKVLARLLGTWQAEPPLQVLLPSNRPPITLRALKSGEIRTALKDLY